MIFEISVANLIVIAVTVVIFGAALLIPFHVGSKLTSAADSADSDEAGGDPSVAAAAEPGDEGMWTARVRTRVARLLPPRKLLPDRQPAYVASWVYVFGVASWIASNGKDALNAMGVGAFFKRDELRRDADVAHRADSDRPGGHRRRQCPDGAGPRRQPAAARAPHVAAQDAGPWRGPNRRYDIVKEGTIATVIVSALVLVMAGLLSSPDVPPVTVQTWARIDQVGFVNTAATELDGTGGAASYGPPYNSQSGSVQQVGPINWQKLAGITQPVNAGQDFVLRPLSRLARNRPALARALGIYNGAPPAEQQKWVSAYDAATAPGAKKVPFDGGNLNLPAAAPVPVMMSSELSMARSGALDSDLLAQRQFFGTDFTKPLLFIADGGYYGTLASSMHLTGDQWGVMNETGSYPGQPWFWLFQLWYHVSPFASSGSVDIWAVYLTGICTILLLLIPFIPGLRDIPRLIPVHRLIWRSWYRSAPDSDADTGKGPGGGPDASQAQLAERGRHGAVMSKVC